jgi:pentatricopeptide repeat protein
MFFQELEADGFDFNTASHVYIIEAYLQNDKIEEALQIYQKLCDSDPDFRLNPNKTLNLVKYLVEHEQYDSKYSF